MAATNKRLLISESRSDLNRCTPCRGKPNQHAFHTRFALGPRPYISHGPRGQSFTSPHEDETDPYIREKSCRPKTDWRGRRLESPHSPALTIALE
jgi:hypothetical protein